jgi:hypothetical protein
MKTHHRFNGPTRIAVRKGVCPVCGKKGARQSTIQHTVSPFNRNPDGSVRTYAEVAECVGAEAAAWASRPFVHAKCEEP